MDVNLVPHDNDTNVPPFRVLQLQLNASDFQQEKLLGQLVDCFVNGGSIHIDTFRRGPKTFRFPERKDVGDVDSDG